MAPPTLLAGPPEILPAPQWPRKWSDLLKGAASSHINDAPSVRPVAQFRDNSATVLATGNFHIVPNTPPEYLESRLQQAWSHSPLTTLKLICDLRGVRGAGKSDKEGFYTAALWLHRHHPKTLATNFSSLAEFGCFKDLPEILYRLIEGADVRQFAREERRKTKAQRRRKPKAVNRKPKEAPITKEGAKELREHKRVAKAKKALDWFNLDPDYRFLHERISDLFAERLKSDLESLNSGRINKIGLAAKWCPSLDSSYDRSTLLCESIARKIFPRDSVPEYAEIEDAHYAYRVRERLRKEVLTPLRRALELPEVYMSAKRWSELPYSRVSSIAMKTYKKHFVKHDRDRFAAYLASVKAGESKIAAGALLPHEVIKSALNDRDGGAVAELQWKRMVDDLARNGKMKNCIALCDVSGSMSGESIEVSIALGILVSELSEEPWKGKVITFSQNPELQIIQGEDLKSKVSFVKNMDYRGMNADFGKVLKKLLKVAVNAKLRPNQMIKRVLVFSGMEFAQGSGRWSSSWSSDYMVIKKKYEEKGYPVPQIVFWNLRDSRATPVAGDQKGVALVSGFSKNVMRLFLGDNVISSPMDVMMDSISGEAYEKLVVFGLSCTDDSNRWNRRFSGSKERGTGTSRTPVLPVSVPDPKVPIFSGSIRFGSFGA